MARSIDPEVKKLLDMRLASGDISRDEYFSLLTALNQGAAESAAVQETSYSCPSPVNSKSDYSDMRIDEDLSIEAGTITYSGDKVSIGRITGLMRMAEVNSIRIGVTTIPSFYRTTLGIVIDERRTITKKAESYFTRKEPHSRIDYVYSYLSKETFAPRLQRLANILRVSGSIDLPTEPPVRLFKTGDIVQKALRANLRVSAKRQQIEYGGSKYLYSVHDPDIIRIRTDGASLFANKIEFTLRMNRDVIMALIKHLTEHDAL